MTSLDDDAGPFLCFSGIPFSNEGTPIGARCLVKHALPRKKAQLVVKCFELIRDLFSVAITHKRNTIYFKKKNVFIAST
jgi:hypothetical protein